MADIGVTTSDISEHCCEERGSLPECLLTYMRLAGGFLVLLCNAQNDPL